jgi:hypothetical protein
MTISDIGFILLNVDNSPIYNTIFSTIKDFIHNHPYEEFVVFSSSCSKSDTMNVPVLHLSHSKFFNGTLFVLDIPSLIITKKFTNYNKKYFYAFDTPWINNNKTPYTQWRNLLADQTTDVIAANNTIYDIYSICWKKPSGISEGFKYEELRSIIEKSEA